MKWIKTLFVACFVAFIALVGIGTLDNKEPQSPIEARTLTQFPDLDYSKLKDENYLTTISNAFSDQLSDREEKIKQYNDLKQKHPDALLLFRCGDFYETYKEDAVKASNILGITLTKHSKRMDEEGKPLKMAGFPYHALDSYLPKLIRAGERVAICDQLESPRQKTSQQEENKPEAKQEVKEVVSAQKEERHGMHR